MNQKIDRFFRDLFRYDHPIGLLNTFRQDRFFLLMVLALGTTAFLTVSQAWPMQFGRDYQRYFIYFHNFPYGANLYSVPLSPLILGGLFKLGENAFYLFYLGSYLFCLFGIYYTARMFSRIFARLVTIACLLHFQFVLFHMFVNSDVLFTLSSMILSVTLVRYSKAPSLSGHAWIGLAALSTFLIRPAE